MEVQSHGCDERVLTWRALILGWALLSVKLMRGSMICNLAFSFQTQRELPATKIRTSSF